MTSVPKPSGLTAGLALEYDAWNRLVQVDDGTDAIAKFEYDGVGRRIARHYDSAAPALPDGTLDVFEHYYYAGARLVETRRAAFGIGQAKRHNSAKRERLSAEKS